MKVLSTPLKTFLPKSLLIEILSTSLVENKLEIRILSPKKKELRSEKYITDKAKRKSRWPKKYPPGRQGIHFFLSNFQTILTN